MSIIAVIALNVALHTHSCCCSCVTGLNLLLLCVGNTFPGNTKDYIPCKASVKLIRDGCFIFGVILVGVEKKRLMVQQ